jgi:hypothetical protein
LGGIISLLFGGGSRQYTRGHDGSNVAVSCSGKLERLKVAAATLGWDTNYTWLQSRIGQLDKRPALEYLIGIDRQIGVYIPELAEK